jgi:hypothetical protein
VSFVLTVQRDLNLAYLQAVSGKPDEARKALGRLKDLSRRQYISPYSIAAIYSGLGDKDQVFELLEKDYNDRDFNIALLPSDPRFDAVSGDSRFKDLLRRIGLPQ